MTTQLPFLVTPETLIGERLETEKSFGLAMAISKVSFGCSCFSSLGLVFGFGLLKAILVFQTPKATAIPNKLPTKIAARSSLRIHL